MNQGILEHACCTEAVHKCALPSILDWLSCQFTTSLFYHWHVLSICELLNNVPLPLSLSVYNKFVLPLACLTLIYRRIAKQCPPSAFEHSYMTFYP
jgi:hypothetical protein